jgi:glutathione S-transferase
MSTGLFLEDDWDAARCDMLVDYVDDFRNPIGGIFFEQNEEVKVNTNYCFQTHFSHKFFVFQKQKLNKYIEDSKAFLDNFEKLLTENGHDGYLVGSKVRINEP